MQNVIQTAGEIKFVITYNVINFARITIETNGHQVDFKIKRRCN